jgi:hypothetical protein
MDPPPHVSIRVHEEWIHHLKSRSGQNVGMDPPSHVWIRADKEWIHHPTNQVRGGIREDEENNMSSHLPKQTCSFPTHIDI